MMAVLRWMWALIFFVPILGLSQQTPPAPRQAEVSPSPRPANLNRSITLDVVVTDKSGKPLTGLQQQDFRLLEEKEEEKIVSFHAVQGSSTADPIHVILLIDTVNTSFQNMGFEREQIQKFLLQNDGQLAHPVSLMMLSDTEIKPLGRASRDGKALSALFRDSDNALRQVNRSAGFFGAAEQFRISLHALAAIAAREEDQPGKKILVWISPGWPLLSGANVQMRPSDQQSLFTAIVGLSTSLRRANITLYSIDPLGTEDASRTGYYREYLKGVTAWDRANPGNLALQVLAEQTGGLTFTGSNDIAGSISSCAADADSFYVLEFDPSPADRANEYHSIAVKVGRLGLTARTRSGYYGQP